MDKILFDKITAPTELEKNLHTVATIPKWILWPFIILLILIVLMEMWWKKIPEYVWFGEELGNLIYQFGLSFCAAAIFYFFTVYLKGIEDYRKRAIFLAEKIIKIERILVKFKDKLVPYYNREPRHDSPTDSDFSNIDNVRQVFSKVGLKEPIKVKEGVYELEKKWYEHIRDISSQIRSEIEQIALHIDVLDNNEFNKFKNLELCDLHDKTENWAKVIQADHDIHPVTLELYYVAFHQLHNAYLIFGDNFIHKNRMYILSVIIYYMNFQQREVYEHMPISKKALFGLKIIWETFISNNEYTMNLNLYNTSKDLKKYIAYLENHIEDHKHHQFLIYGYPEELQRAKDKLKNENLTVPK